MILPPDDLYAAPRPDKIGFAARNSFKVEMTLAVVAMRSCHASRARVTPGHLACRHYPLMAAVRLLPSRAKQELNNA